MLGGTVAVCGAFALNYVGKCTGRAKAVSIDAAMCSHACLRLVILITGVLGPHSNAHGPNEFLHIPMGKRVTACVARVIAERHVASQRGETIGVAAVAGGEQHGDHGCC